MKLHAVTFQVLIFSGGFETTANALTFMCFLLAKHQDIQEKVYREIIDNIEVRPNHS